MNVKKLLRDYGIAILIAVSIALLIRKYLIESYRVPTAVMSPTLEAGDLIFVSKFPYLDEEPPNPQYGEIVVFSPPKDGSRNYIKRILGLPGDKIEVKDGRLIFNDKLLSFEAQHNQTCGFEKHPKATYQICLEPPLMKDFGPKVVQPDQVFVIGDSRKEGLSRISMLMTPQNSILARVNLIWLSIHPNRTGWIPQIRFERMLRSVQ